MTVIGAENWCQCASDDNRYRLRRCPASPDLWKQFQPAVLPRRGERSVLHPNDGELAPGGALNCIGMPVPAPAPTAGLATSNETISHSPAWFNRAAAGVTLRGLVACPHKPEALARVEVALAGASGLCTGNATRG